MVSKFLCHFNGTASYEVLELDHCLVGLGGRRDGTINHLAIVKHYKNLHISQLKMISILVAVRLFGSNWKNKKKFWSNVIIKRLCMH